MLRSLPSAGSSLTHIWWAFLPYPLDLSFMAFQIPVVFLVWEARITLSLGKHLGLWNRSTSKTGWIPRLQTCQNETEFLARGLPVTMVLASLSSTTIGLCLPKMLLCAPSYHPSVSPELDAGVEDRWLVQDTWLVQDPSEKTFEWRLLRLHQPGFDQR